MTELARSGCFMEFDHFGVYEDTSIRYMGKFGDHGATDAQAMDKIEFLVDGGFGDQVVISHDANFKHQFTRYGGKEIAHPGQHPPPPESQGVRREPDRRPAGGEPTLRPDLRVSRERPLK